MAWKGSDSTPSIEMDEHFQPDELSVEGGATELPRAGTLMIERQSYERIIEGAKLAADGARHLSPYFDHQQWDNVAVILDQVRLKAVKIGGIGQPADSVLSAKHFGEPSMLRNDAYSRVYDGLTNLANGALQMASCHRGDTRWSAIAFMAYSMRDSAGKLIRKKFAPAVATLFGRSI